MALASPTPLDRAYHRAHFIFWIVSAGALLLKLLLATLEGTMDVKLFSQWGAVLAHSSFATAYASSELFNTPPVAASYAALLSSLAGSGTIAFGFFLRLPGILAETIFAIVLWRRFAHTAGPRRWVAAIFVLNPMCLAITGFHGNLDSLLAVVLGVALLSAMDERPVACALWLALAANLKISSLLVLPAFFFWWLARGRARPFALVAGLGILAGWSPGLLAAPHLFLTRVISYSGLWGTWGITKLLYLTGAPDFHIVQYGAPAGRSQVIASVLKLVVVAAALALAWRRRHLAAPGLVGTVAAIWTVFFVFAPAGAAQYTIWLVLPLLLYQVRLGVLYLAAATPFMVIFYPAAFVVILGFNPYPGIVSLLPSLTLQDTLSWTQPALFLWAVLVLIFLHEAPRWWRHAESPAAP